MVFIGIYVLKARGRGDPRSRDTTNRTPETKKKITPPNHKLWPPDTNTGHHHLSATKLRWEKGTKGRRGVKRAQKTCRRLLSRWCVFFIHFII
jgi:hypothetical protein